MTKQEAIDVIYEITNGSGVNREDYPKAMRGELANFLWNDGAFTLGIEYGYVLALRTVFDIKDCCKA